MNLNLSESGTADLVRLVNGQYRVEAKLDELAEKFETQLDCAADAHRQALVKVEKDLGRIYDKLSRQKVVLSRECDVGDGASSYIVVQDRSWTASASNSECEDADSVSKLRSRNTTSNLEAHKHLKANMKCISLPPDWPSSLQMRPNMAKPCRDSQVFSGKDDFLSVAFRNREEVGRGRKSFDLTRAASVSLQKVNTQCLGFAGCGPRFKPFHPQSRFRMFFDILCPIVLINDLMVTPYNLAWGVKVTGLWRVWSLVGTLFWVVDMGLNFVTAHFKHGELEIRWGKIARHYLQTRFLLDIFLIFCDLVNLVTWVRESDEGSANQWGMIRMLKAGRVLRVMAMLRAERLKQALERLAELTLNDNILFMARMGKYVISTLLFNHVVCCAWFAIGNLNLDLTDTRETWLHVPLPVSACDGLHAGSECSVQTAVSSYQYMLAFHWVIAQITLGSIEVGTRNSIERAFNVMLLMFGLLFGSVIVSSVSTMAMQHTMAANSQTHKRDTLRRFLGQHNTSLDIIARVLQQVDGAIQDGKYLVEKDVPALAMLDSKLRSELFFAIRNPHLLSHPLFRMWVKLDRAACQRLCQRGVVFQFQSRGDDVFSPGTAAMAAYNVAKGSLSYDQHPQTSMVSEPSTKVVGSGTWISEPALWLQWTHVGHLTAQGPSEMIMVVASELVAVLEAHHVIDVITRTYAKNYYARVIAAMPPHANWPDDLQVAHTDFTDLMSRDVSMELLKYSVSTGKVAQDMEAELQAEIFAGKCALQETTAGDIERVVNVAALMITDIESRVIVQVGSWKPGSTPKIGPKLPGTKRCQGELPAAAAERVLSLDLAPFCEGVRLTHARQEVDVQKSATYGVVTRYFRTVHYGHVEEEEHTHEIHIVGRTPDEAAPPDERIVILAVADKKSVMLWSWLREEDVLLFRTSKDGEKEITKRLELVDIQDEALHQVWHHWQTV